MRVTALDKTIKILRPRLHDTGMKLCRLKSLRIQMLTRYRQLYLLQLLLIALLKFAC